MIVTFIILWFLTFLMLKYDWQTVSTRWAALITFCGGCGGFARAWLESFAPYLREFGLGGAWLELSAIPLYNAGSFINTIGLPYAFLLFACRYSVKLSPPAFKSLAVLGAIPIPVMLWLTPFAPMVAHNYRLLLTWVGPYIAAGAFLLIYTYTKSTTPTIKSKHSIVMLLALPPVLFQLLTNYILRAFDFHQAWRLNVISISVLLLIYATFAYRHGLFGLRLRLERNRMGRTLQAFSSGATLLQHTVKSETAKILMLAEQLNHVAGMQQLQEMKLPIKHIQSSAEHLIHMMERLQHHAQGIVLLEENVNLHHLINSALLSVNPHLMDKKIIVRQKLPEEVALLCDPVHMKEVIQNIVVNAAEASDLEGIVVIEASIANKKLLLTIRDYGSGIAKQHMKYVFDPFFTTKPLKTNYGLGLTYCHKVVDAHGGVLHITSKEKTGTTVQIQWPSSKLLSDSLRKKENADEQHQGIAG